MTDSHRGQARYTAHYTKQEIEAYLEATITNGLKATEAMRRAIAGELKPGLAPFGKKARSGKLVFGYSISQTHGEAYIAANPVLQAEDTHAIALALHMANKRDAKALAESETATMAERTRAAKEMAESYKALASLEPKTTRPPKEKASDRKPLSVNEVTTQSQRDVLAQLSELAIRSDTASAGRNTATDVGDSAPGPVRSLAS